MIFRKVIEFVFLKNIPSYILDSYQTQSWFKEENSYIAIKS